MDYKGFSIDVKAKLSSSGRMVDVSYQVRRAGESGIAFQGLIAREFASEKDATDAALLKARKGIDEANAGRRKPEQSAQRACSYGQKTYSC